jgi:hypothetical protein
MMSKQRIIILLCVLATTLTSVESCTIPQTQVLATIPAGWNVLPTDGVTVVLRGPGRIPAAIPRLSLATAAGDPVATCASLRSSLLRVTDGCRILDDDEIPIGGRVWRRLRVRFAVGPAQFGQSAWIGSVSGITIIVVLSAPEDELPAYLSMSAALLTSLRATP